MAEETKKTTTKKTNTTAKKKNTNNKKTTTTKKVNNQKNKANNNKNNSNKKQQKPTPKKKAQPKSVVKKEEPKETKVTEAVEKTKKVEKVIEPKEEKVVEKEIEKAVEKETEESVLEKTLIFDGSENKNLAEVVEKLEEDHVILDDKVIKRSKAKKIIVNILIALIFVTIIGTTIYVIYHEKEQERNSQTLNSNIFDKVSNKYGSASDIKTENKNEKDPGTEDFENIETITLGQFEKNILDKKDMTVIVTSTTCYYSMEYEPIVDEVYKDLNQVIYRINVTSLTTEEVKRFRTYYAFEETPTIFQIKNGVVSKELVGKQSKEDLVNWLK